MKNMQKYVSVKNLDIFPDIFIKYQNFPLEPKFFFFHEKHTFFTILHLLICISKNYKKKIFKSQQSDRFLPYGGGVSERYGLVRNFIFFYAFPYIHQLIR